MSPVDGGALDGSGVTGMRGRAEFARSIDGLNFSALTGVEEDAVCPHELEAVPLGRVVTGGENERSGSTELCHH